MRMATKMIEIILILIGCAAISMFIIFGFEMYKMVQEFIKLDKKSKEYQIKNAIPILIVFAIFLSIITKYIFKIIADNALY